MENLLLFQSLLIHQVFIYMAKCEYLGHCWRSFNPS